MKRRVAKILVAQLPQAPILRRVPAGEFMMFQRVST